MSRTNSYSNHWWYQLVYGYLYSWRLNNSYVWLCIKKELTLFVRIHTTLLLDINCSCEWMRKTEMVWCEFYPTKTNHDKEVPQEKCCKRKKPSAKIHLLIQVSKLWKKCQSDALSHRTNQCQWHRTESQQWPEIINLAIQKTYTNWYNCNWN